MVAAAGMVVFALCGTSPVSAQSLDPARQVTQYRLRSWTDESGLPQNSVAAVIQLKDGTVLAGTQEGLALFDGSKLEPPTWEPLASVGQVWVNRLLQDDDGSIWIATRGRGLLLVTAPGVRAFGRAEGLLGESVESLYRDRAGVLWIGTSDAGLFRLDGLRAVAVPLGDFPGSEFIQSISADARGRTLVGTRGGLFRAESPTRWERFGREHGLPSEHVYALTPAVGDTVWLGTANGGLAVLTSGGIGPVRGWAGTTASVFAIRSDSLGGLWIATNGGGLLRFYRGETASLTTSNGFPSNLVWALGSDHEGGLWAGTNGGGLVRLDDPAVTVFGAPEGLSSDIALATLQSRDGTLWVGTAGGGLNSIKDGVVRRFTTSDGLASNIVTALHEDPGGTLWIGTAPAGLHVLRAGRITRVDLEAAFPGAGINTIRVDGRGRVWVGSNGGGLGVRENGRWRFLRAPESLPSNFVQAMAVDSAGVMYVGTRSGLVAVRGDKLVRQPVFADPVKNIVVALHASPSGSLWMGSHAPGISRLRAGRLVHIGPDHGLPRHGVNGILEDGSANLWLATNGGIFAVARAELEAVADGTRPRVKGYMIGRAEGMRSRETNGGVDPPGEVGRGGEIWVPTMRGVVHVDAERITRAAKPLVSVTGLVVEDTRIPARKGLRLAPQTRRFAIAFRVLSFEPTDALVAQYRLRGVDPGWVDAAASRRAEYTSLAPGEHHFEVRARHRLGTWGPTQAITFGREPRWWERRAVQALALLLLAALLLAAHRIRLRYWKHAAGRYESSAAEKEMILAAVRERETRFKALLEHASDGIFLLDAGGTISYVSPSMERIINRASDLLLGKQLVDLSHPGDRPGVVTALDVIARRPRIPTPFRYRVELPEVGWRTFSAIGRNLLEEPVVGGVIVNARDVTEQEEAENLFRQAQKVDAIGNLAGGIAHDFNNLLAVIDANVSMVKDDLAEMQVTVEGLDEIIHATAGGERLTRQLLSFSKRQPANPTLVDLNRIVEETVPMLRPLLGSSVAIVVKPASRPASIYVDHSEMEQVIVNLVVNAKGAMPQGGTVTLAVKMQDGLRPEARPQSRVGAYVVLSVRDTGTGMDASTREKIFDPFFTTKGSGTGLGLATVSWITKKAHGFIEVDSEPGEGTEFRVHLPVAEDMPPVTEGRPESRLSGTTVLVVDDEDAVRKIAERILRDAGAEVLGAASGQQALEIAHATNQPIHVLLTDLVMPGMSGRELSEKLVALRPVSVLYMSGYTDDEIARSRSEGMDVGFLPKPFKPDSLVAAIETALGRPAPSVERS